MSSIEVDIVIPTFNSNNKIINLIHDIKNQKNIAIKKIVIPVTKVDEDNSLLSVLEDENKVSFFLVEKEEFSHSLTREKAIREYCSSDIVVLMSHDVKLVNEDSIYQLVKDINNKKCAYTFGRQVCPKKSIEKYIREKNYPLSSYVVKKDDIDELQTMAFFASDAFSALDRNVFIKIGGYQNIDLITNEDMFYSYHLLMNGYVKCYVADAVVEHYHKYTLKELYRRYYQVGQFYMQVDVFNQYKNKSTGASLAFYVLGQSFKHFDIVSIFTWLPNMCVRYLGFKKGRKA